MTQLHLHCSMCWRKFTRIHPHRGRIPLNCPECRKRRKTEQCRINMARLRSRQRASGRC